MDKAVLEPRCPRYPNRDVLSLVSENLRFQDKHLYRCATGFDDSMGGLFCGRGATLHLRFKTVARSAPPMLDPMIVKGVFGKSVGSNFGVRATGPGAIGILSEIPARAASALVTIVC